MVARRDLNRRPGMKLADRVEELREEIRQKNTRAHGQKDMGETGDTTWTTPGGEPKSVRRFAVKLDDTTKRAEVLAQRIADAEQQLEAAEGRLLEAREALAALDTRVKTSSLQVSRGPLPPAGAPLGAQWLTPEGYLYVRVDCDEEAA